MKEGIYKGSNLAETIGGIHIMIRYTCSPKPFYAIGYDP